MSAEVVLNWFRLKRGMDATELLRARIEGYVHGYGVAWEAGVEPRSGGPRSVSPPAIIVTTSVSTQCENPYPGSDSTPKGPLELGSMMSAGPTPEDAAVNHTSTASKIKRELFPAIPAKENINLASRGAIRRQCRGIGPQLAYILVAQRELLSKGFTSWDEKNDPSSVIATKFIGEELIKQLREKFELFPVCNVNTASSAELQQAMFKSMECGRCKKDTCEECKRLKLGDDIKVVADIIVKEHEFFDDFESWEDVKERVSRGGGNYNFTPENAVEMLKKQRVLCISSAEEEAAVARAGNLNQVFNYVLGYSSSSKSQLEQWDLRKLARLAEHYGIKRTHKRADLMEKILEEEQRRIVKKVVSSIIDHIISDEEQRIIKTVVEKLVSDTITASAEESRNEESQQNPMQRCAEERNVTVDSRPAEVWQVNLQALEDEVWLSRLDKQGLAILAKHRYGINWKNVEEGRKRDNQYMIDKIMEKNKALKPKPETVWEGEHILSVGSWNMKLLSESTMSGKDSRNMQIILNGLNEFDVVALLEVFKDNTMKMIRDALEEHSGDAWGWLKSKPRLQVESDETPEDSKGEFVGFLWRKKKVILTSSKDGDAGGEASTLKQDGARMAPTFFHRTPAVARFQSKRDPSFQFVLVAAHVTFGKYQPYSSTRAREIELQNLAAAVKKIQGEEAKMNACVWCVGDFNLNPPHDPSKASNGWEQLLEAGWKPHVRDRTMVQTNNIYDNIIARVHDGDTDNGIILLKHPSKSDGIRARVGVIDMVGHMNSVTKILENVEKAAEPAGVSQATESKSMATYFDTFVQNIFKLKVSDHLPVRMQIELPTNMTDERYEIKTVGGLNLTSAPGSLGYRLINSGSTRKQNGYSSAVTAVNKSNKNKGGMSDGKGASSGTSKSCHRCRTKKPVTVTVRDRAFHQTCTIPPDHSYLTSLYPIFPLQCTKCTSVYFCDACMNIAHGEYIDKAIESKEWVCPPCRGSCGEGCVTCCTCTECRKVKELPLTGLTAQQLVKESEFDNLHDYLVCCEIKTTTQEELRERKKRHEWGQWLKEDFVPSPQDDQDEEVEGSDMDEDEDSQTHAQNLLPVESRLKNDFKLKRRTVPGDGNCQFHALAHQLAQHLSNEMDHTELRRIAVQEIATNQDRYKDFYLEGEFDAELQRISRDGEWGDERTLQAVAQTFSVRIHVVSAYEHERDRDDYMPRDVTHQEQERNELPRLTIIHYPGSNNKGLHYDSTEPLTDGDNEDIVHRDG